MPGNPRALEDLSVEVLCGQLRDVLSSAGDQAAAVERVLTGAAAHPLTNCAYSRRVQASPSPAPIVLAAPLADRLFARAKRDQLINEGTLPLFDRRFARLTRLDLSSIQPGANALSLVQQHDLVELDLRWLQHHPQIWMGEQAAEEELTCDRLLEASKPGRLRRLRLGGVAAHRQDVVQRVLVNLYPHLDALTALSLIETVHFDHACLAVVCGRLRSLNYLDISQTSVVDIEPLRLLRRTLETVVLHRVPLAVSRSNSAAVDVLLDLAELRRLDISQFVDAPSDATDGGVLLLGRQLVVRLYERTDALLNLEQLDLSGHQLDTLDWSSFQRRFLAPRTNMRFLGLLYSAFAHACPRTHHLQVAGDASRGQILNGLRAYCRPDREPFSAKSLHNLFHDVQPLTAYPDEDILNCVQLVCECMRVSLAQGQRGVAVPMAASACLYHLCRVKMPLLLTRAGLVGQMLERCLDALGRFPKQAQLHKNVWLTLCNDALLHSAAFDMERCCSLALQSMVANADAAISRMTMAIVSILAAKMPTEKTEALGCNADYMRFLLDILEAKSAAEQGLAAGNPVDVSLKFALSALWNLTDESPRTCALFMAEGGLAVTLKVLKSFPDATTLQVKVLGLLNNVAEVEALKQHMAVHEMLIEILKLLDSDKLDVRYFAAGVLANLCVGQAWNFEPSTAACQDKLWRAVRGWTTPEEEMVAYRSFAPFLPLLARDQAAGSQLWALWAVRHVCTKNAGRYVQLFRRQAGFDAVRRLLERARHTPQDQARLNMARDVLALDTQQ